MDFLCQQLAKLDGYKTYLLAVFVTILWFIRLFLLDDAEAAIVMGGISMGALLAGLGALIWGGKSGTAKLKQVSGD